MSPIKPVEPSDPEDYIGQIDVPERRADIEALDQLIREEAPQLEPHIYGSMLGYGTYRYRYASGREGEAALIGLASQKRHISIYSGCTDDGGYLADRYRDRLPAADIGKSCVRFKRLADLDEEAIRSLVRESATRFADNPNFAVVE